MDAVDLVLQMKRGFKIFIILLMVDPYVHFLDLQSILNVVWHFLSIKGGRNSKAAKIVCVTVSLVSDTNKYALPSMPILILSSRGMCISKILLILHYPAMQVSNKEKKMTKILLSET